MKLRLQESLALKSRDELYTYIGELEAEVIKLKRTSRCHRKSMREMQAKLEKNNLILAERKQPPVQQHPHYSHWQYQPWYGQPFYATTAKLTCDTE